MSQRAGRLRYLVSVQQNVPTRDTDGHETPVWTEVAQAKADIKPVSGQEFWAGAGIVGRQPVEIETRYDSRFAAIAPEKWRIVYDGVIYDIVSAVVDRLLRRKVAIMAVTGTAVPNE